MIAAFAKAVQQLFDPTFRRVIWRAIGLSLIVFVALLVGLSQAMEMLPSFDWALLDWVVKAAVWLGGIGLTVLFFPAAATLFIAIYLDDIAQAVERRHYPDDLPGQAVPLGRSIVLSIRFAALVVALNILVLPLYLFIVSLPLIFYSLNGYLLGREYFELVARRHVDESAVQQMRKLHGFRVFIAGVVSAVLLTVPLVNLLAPIVATAAMVHLFKRLAAADGVGASQ